MPVVHAARYISKPDAKLQILRRTVENAKALYEYAKGQYDRAEERILESGVGRADWIVATEAYSFSVGRYCGAMTELNRYLFDCAFPPEQKAFRAVA